MSKDQRPGPVHGLTAENLLRTFPMALAGDPTAAALAQITARLLASRPPEIDRLRIYPDIGRLDEALLDILSKEPFIHRLVQIVLPQAPPSKKAAPHGTARGSRH